MQYYYAKKEEKIGPLTLDELKKVDIKDDTLVWHEGLDDWVKSEEVKELRVLFNEETKNNSIKDTITVMAIIKLTIKFFTKQILNMFLSKKLSHS